MKKILSIAGSDSSGGAGIQADIKTVTMFNMFAMTAITALTAQNTMGVTQIVNTPPKMVRAQIDAVFSDIRPDAVKIGMLSDPAIIEAVADGLISWKADNIVLDPVMVSTSGCSLISDDAASTMTARLFPLASIITPNLPEAGALLGRAISSVDEMESAGRELVGRYQCAVLIKGGHLSDTAADVLVDRTGEVVWFRVARVNNPNTHGTGCTLSSAIACGLADGLPLEKAVEQAKQYVYGAISAGLNLGQGSGPLNHMWKIGE